MNKQIQVTVHKPESEKDTEIRKLVIARLSALSQNTMISIGSKGELSVEELVKRVKSGDEIGNKIIQIQLEWLRSFKDEMSYANSN